MITSLVLFEDSKPTSDRKSDLIQPIKILRSLLPVENLQSNKVKVLPNPPFIPKKLQLSSTNQTVLDTLTISSIQNVTYPSSDFVSLWFTDTQGISDTKSIHLPLIPSGSYNFTVDWGDNTTNLITAWNQSEVTHTYPQAGSYIVIINGTIQGWSFNYSGDKLKINNIMQWGCLKLGNSGGYFAGSSHLVISATDIPDLNESTNFSQMFYQCISLGMVRTVWHIHSLYLNMSSI